MPKAVRHQNGALIFALKESSNCYEQDKVCTECVKMGECLKHMHTRGLKIWKHNRKNWRPVSIFTLRKKWDGKE